MQSQTTKSDNSFTNRLSNAADITIQAAYILGVFGQYYAWANNYFCQYGINDLEITEYWNGVDTVCALPIAINLLNNRNHLQRQNTTDGVLYIVAAAVMGALTALDTENFGTPGFMVAGGIDFYIAYNRWSLAQKRRSVTGWFEDKFAQLKHIDDQLADKTKPIDPTSLKTQRTELIKIMSLRYRIHTPNLSAIIKQTNTDNKIIADMSTYILTEKDHKQNVDIQRTLDDTADECAFDTLIKGISVLGWALSCSAAAPLILAGAVIVNAIMYYYMVNLAVKLCSTLYNCKTGDTATRTPYGLYKYAKTTFFNSAPTTTSSSPSAAVPTPAAATAG